MSTGTNKTTPPRKTKPKGRHPDKALSAAFVRTAPPGRHADGNGLYLFVQPSGTRSWIQRLVIRGRRRELGLGSVALVSLAEAREKALANRKLAREGGDPLAEKRRAQGVPSFAEATARVVEQKRAGARRRWPETTRFVTVSVTADAKIRSVRKPNTRLEGVEPLNHVVQVNRGDYGQSLHTIRPPYCLVEHFEWQRKRPLEIQIDVQLRAIFLADRSGSKMVISLILIGFRSLQNIPTR